MLMQLTGVEVGCVVGDMVGDELGEFLLCQHIHTMNDTKTNKCQASWFSFDNMKYVHTVGLFVGRAVI